MHLVTALVGTFRWRADVDELLRVLRASTAAGDGVEHVYIEVRDETLAISLYLLAVDAEAAARRAEQLIRRAMVSAAHRRGSWRLCATRSAGLRLSRDPPG